MLANNQHSLAVFIMKNRESRYCRTVEIKWARRLAYLPDRKYRSGQATTLGARQKNNCTGLGFICKPLFTNPSILKDATGRECLLHRMVNNLSMTGIQAKSGCCIQRACSTRFQSDHSSPAIGGDPPNVSSPTAGMYSVGPAAMYRA
ncbi:hypothetical protein DESC_350015 [Desulfosarcina cetonica]|nr:hypothetical protein DESC_350015 [Desulfosarcina cetonica]